MSKVVVGVVGSGAMGAGITQVAAGAGHHVRLYDQRDGAAKEACERIGAALSKRVVEGKLKLSDQEQVLSRITLSRALEEFADCGLVIEAITEALEPKRALFANLERVVDPTSVLATNTSSLSVTALGRGLRHAERFLGLHFFNPVPAMKLVEVVSGLATDVAVVGRMELMMRQWGKTPVAARSTPGFIVNRIARPFYAEALWLLQERRATPAQIDQCFRAAAFRMGPCELMDLIGHDVNLAATESVYTASYGDKRFVPSPLQRELVDAGRLGRKSGRGFYKYAGQPVEGDSRVESVASVDNVACSLSGAGPTVEVLARTFSRAQLPVERRSHRGSLRLTLTLPGEPPVILGLTDGRPAGQLAQEADSISAVFDWPLGDTLPERLAVAFAPLAPERASNLACAILQRIGTQPVIISDTPGLIVARTVAMLVNEAADAVQQGVCDQAAADTAMKLGVNYPSGPFEWLARCGPTAIVTLLDHLQRLTGSERYRISPLLRERHWKSMSETETPRSRGFEGAEIG